MNSFSVILTSSAIAQNDPKILALGLRKTIKGYLSISEGMKHSLLNNAPNYKHNFENTYYHINIYLCISMKYVFRTWRHSCLSWY